MWCTSVDYRTLHMSVHDIAKTLNGIGMAKMLIFAWIHENYMDHWIMVGHILIFEVNCVFRQILLTVNVEGSNSGFIILGNTLSKTNPTRWIVS